MRSRALPLLAAAACVWLAGCELIVNPDPTLVPGFYGVDAGFTTGTDGGSDGRTVDGASTGDVQVDVAVDDAAPKEAGAPPLDSATRDGD